MKLVKKLFDENEFKWTAYRFYLVGILLFILPFARPLFFTLIPWILLLNMTIMLFYHRLWNIRTVVIFALVYLLSFTLEMAGVADERLFGSYQYLGSLGIAIQKTPLMIGINWLMLIYGSHALVSLVYRNKLVRILFASALMVFYDVFAEFVAPHMLLWTFGQPYPPFRNFAMWFVASLVFLSLFEIFRIETRHNAHARTLFVAQIIFFAVLSFYTLAFNP